MDTSHAFQGSLFGGDEPRVDPRFGSLRRVELEEGAWLDVVPGWLSGHARVFEALRTTLEWRSGDRQMYERKVEIPRLMASFAEGEVPPIVGEMRACLDRRYETRFERIILALYRDGADSVAWHGDHVARRMNEALVATVSLGAPRKFLIRKTGGGRSMAFSLGWGDLLVMGGSCQRTYQHCVPKVARAAPRIALMFRPVWEGSLRDPY